MRQMISVVAVNFNDLLQLKQAVKKALNGLSHIPAEDTDVSITFDWEGDKWRMRIQSCSSHQECERCTPNGVSSPDWASLILEELENHLLSGSQFILNELLGGIQQGYLRLRLKRA